MKGRSLSYTLKFFGKNEKQRKTISETTIMSIKKLTFSKAVPYMKHIRVLIFTDLSKV